MISATLSLWFCRIFEVFGDLCREFARRLEDQCARHACAPTLFQHCQHRQHEGCGFSSAGLRNPSTSPEHVRDVWS
jgi:hypothetical protein